MYSCPLTIENGVYGGLGFARVVMLFDTKSKTVDFPGARLIPIGIAPIVDPAERFCCCSEQQKRPRYSNWHC